MGEPGEAEKLAVVPLSSSPPPSESSSSVEESEREELQRLEHAPPFWRKSSRKRLSKQLSMCETPRDVAWERRRRQILRQERRRQGVMTIINDSSDDLTDDDLNELKGCIELGFGFNEEDGQSLCNTLPALDLYFAVNRQLSTSPLSSPNSRLSTSSVGGGESWARSLGSRSSSFDSPGTDSDSWKICSPGDDPQQVKTKLRHWAQAVACSVMQSS
ncbi:1-phosphatidylinositol-4,5-bisphosphate phosphodiesterase epsilon-1, putative [Actinidia rufa]|uniref:1-phosphatidylinositol-4,5-bisphosphate phosphodiesterase epsilon-1, putative n=1 Tax=Actinidia rufa TaxID=165716 RepID=A0A7J0FA37_9ERIC|nr:1-phosphatidylinositol-4,5-bisphosphate phosphodiesterase epsilon-1, putative [Actinidia rufa]